MRSKLGVVPSLSNTRTAGNQPIADQPGQLARSLSVSYSGNCPQPFGYHRPAALSQPPILGGIPFCFKKGSYLLSSMQKTALLAGATGLIGSQLLPLLLASERYAKVIVVGRTALPLSHPKLIQVVTELSRLQDVRLQLIADDVFCCLGTTRRQAGSKEAFYKVDFLYVVTLAALTAGNFASQLMVMSSLGADAEARVYYSQVKGQMEESVRGMAFRAIHIFRPSLLLGQRAQPRLGEWLGAALLGVLRPLLRGPLLKYRPVAAATVAAAMLRAAEDDGGGVRVHSSDEIAAAA